ncbi:hypothetical protein PYCC9005_003784 [Savitreella phatthalungensis]
MGPVLRSRARIPRQPPSSSPAGRATLESPRERGVDGLPIRSFADAPAFGAYLEGSRDGGVWVLFARKHAISGRTLSKDDAVDTALCHGWVDGQQAGYDGDGWLTRFTRRSPRSRWSAVNVGRVERLVREGKMRPAGMEAVEAAKEDGRWEAAYAPSSTALAPQDLQTALDAAGLGQTWADMTRSRKYAIIMGVTTVKRESTRVRKVAEAVEMVKAGK